MNRKKLLMPITIVMGLALCMALSACGSGEGSMQYDGLNLDDYLTVGEYKGLEVDAVKVKVSEQEIQEKVEAALDEHKESRSLKEGDELKSGDVANIDYTGKVVTDKLKENW